MRIYGHLPKHTESPRRFRTATDGGDTKQEHVFCEKNVSLNNVHGRTLFNSLFSKELEGKEIKSRIWREKQKRIFDLRQRSI